MRLDILVATPIPPIYGFTDTTLATGATEAVEVWAAKVWLEAIRKIYWSQFMKKDDPNAVIEVHENLVGRPGEKETFTLLRKLSSSGVAGDATLEDNEEVLTWYSDTVTLDQLRNAVRIGGQMTEKRSPFDLQKSAKEMLKIWLAETIDDDLFTQFDSSPTTTVFGGNATATSNVGSDDTITPAVIDKLVAKAKKATPKVWPVEVNGRGWYVLVIHTDVAYDLRQNTTWVNGQQYAAPRDSKDNPIFSGALGYWGGVVIHEHEKVPVSTAWGSDSAQPGASNIFVGRQAGLFAWGARPKGWSKEFDYMNKRGYAIGCIYDMTKAVFNSADHSMYSLKTYRTNN